MSDAVIRLTPLWAGTEWRAVFAAFALVIGGGILGQGMPRVDAV